MASVSALVDSDTPGPPRHPETEEFLKQFGAFREQLEQNHISADDHRKWEQALDQLESALLTLRKLMAANSKRPPNMALQRPRAPRVPKFWFGGFGVVAIKCRSQWRVPLSFWTLGGNQAAQHCQTEGEIIHV